MTPSFSIRALARADLEEIWLFTLEEWGLSKKGSDFPVLNRIDLTGQHQLQFQLVSNRGQGLL
jgi:hypothetical protein